MADSPSPQLRVRDVADQYGLTERFVRHLVADRRIPHYKIGIALRFDRTELDQWFADQKIDAELQCDCGKTWIMDGFKFKPCERREVV